MLPSWLIFASWMGRQENISADPELQMMHQGIFLQVAQAGRAQKRSCGSQEGPLHAFPVDGLS